MGNLICFEIDAMLSSVARDICPLPNYSPSPHFVNMLSINSSLHLKNHYTAVQSSLTPEQLEDFTQGLRTTFGREGKVTLGGVGVVALSLAVLFDTLARQVRGEWVSESEPIPGLFVKDLRGYYPPQVYTVSKYLRLVPHIANNPTRMKRETKRYQKQLRIDHQSLDKLGENHILPLNEDITSLNFHLSEFFASSLQIHHHRINNSPVVTFAVHRRESPYIIANSNCDEEEAYKDILNRVQKSDNRTQDIFKEVLDLGQPLTWIERVAATEMLSYLTRLTQCKIGADVSLLAQREDFDLKANALGKWAE